MPIIAPSILAANFLQLQQTCTMLNESKADWFHLDIMDGRFVPNISFGIPVVEAIKKATSKILDVHLMIVEPEKYIDDFKKAGADSITVHVEACPHLHRNIQQIKDAGLKAGVALNPHTPICMLENILSNIDMVLIMSVNPGFGGQSFIPHSLHKIKELRKLLNKVAPEVLIEVDGGITLKNAAAVIHSGANVLVAGSAIFNTPHPDATIEQFKMVV
ncbi:MAG: ribulose-phosphate 3-epimerase [Sphingobacteriales bacterium]|uniref:ribulose-phosphate 3-epimerase n=1 Tax=Hydrotalea flava TaxID=714549 RepID=UPI00082FAB6E|nr:ribulose-phosphate 3-epimerase [Hydrotalea flava]RTL55138.1 MAG: ribulose-phosphate 3-epimerase [Sphingobacteriales bacterium]